MLIARTLRAMTTPAGMIPVGAVLRVREYLPGYVIATDAPSVLLPEGRSIWVLPIGDESPITWPRNGEAASPPALPPCIEAPPRSDKRADARKAVYGLLTARLQAIQTAPGRAPAPLIKRVEAWINMLEFTSFSAVPAAAEHITETLALLTLLAASITPTNTQVREIVEEIAREIALLSINGVKVGEKG